MPLYDSDIITPFFIDTGTSFPWTDEVISKRYTSFESCIQKLGELKDAARSKMKKSADRHRLLEPPLQVGEKVLLLNESGPHSKSQPDGLGLLR